MHAFRERTRSHNPTLWVVTTTGDQHCRALHGTSKRERNSGLRALPAHAPALKPPRKARFLFSKSSISLLDCWVVFRFFTEIALENRAFAPVSRPEKPAFHRRNRAFGPVSRPEKPGFHRRNRAFGPISRPEKPGFHRRNRAETGPKIDPQNHCDRRCKCRA